MKLSDLFKNKNQKLVKASAKNLTVKINKKQLEKLTGGAETIERGGFSGQGKVELIAE